MSLLASIGPLLSHHLKRLIPSQVQRNLLSPPEGTPTVSQLVSVIVAPCGTFVFRSSIVADLSKPVAVTDPAWLEAQVPKTMMLIMMCTKAFIVEIIFSGT